MAVLNALSVMLVIILIDYVATKMQFDNDLFISPDECQHVKGVEFDDRCIINIPEVKPDPKAKQYIPNEVIIVPKAKYNMTSDNGFKPLTAAENEYVQAVCGKSKESFARIQNGFKAKPKQFPWIVEFANSCTGVLISPRHMLTAAHCFHGDDHSYGACFPQFANEIKKKVVQYGGNCCNKDKSCPKGSNMKKTSISRVLYLSEDHKYCIENSDLAVVLLKKDIKFNDFVKPICVSKLYIENLVQLRSVGFGNLDEKGTETSILRYMDSKLAKGSTDRQIKTAGAKNLHGMTDICGGDSGGPLQATFEGSNRTYLAGIHSRSSTCDKTKSVIISAYVPAYVDWLCTLTGVCEFE